VPAAEKRKSVAGKRQISKRIYTEEDKVETRCILLGSDRGDCMCGIQTTEDEMKTTIAVLLFLAQSTGGITTSPGIHIISVTSDPGPSITVPKVDKKIEKQVQEYTTVTRTCPAGYEGHFVDPDVGFDGLTTNGELFNSGSGYYTFGSESGGPPMYTMCFKKEFMDLVRKNPDLIATKPIIRPS